MLRRAACGLLGLALAAMPAGAALPPPPAGLTLDRAVLLMRHGVRPPTKDPAMPAGTAAAPWPKWSTPPGELTAHGAQAVALLGAADRDGFVAAGLLPKQGCGAVRIVADSDQRTIATAAAWAATLAPGCTIAADHKPQDEPDPRFQSIDSGAARFDVAAANAAITAGIAPGGIAAEEARVKPLLGRLDAILCGPATTACGVGAKASTLVPATAHGRPKLSGALDRGSTAAQVLLLEYAEGKPLDEVGWGRATAADIASLSALHALEFRLLARPRPVAAANLALILPILVEGLAAGGPARVTLVSGHDTNVANLGGLLGVHWQAPGLAADDPSPGGAIILEALVDKGGARFVRALYRSQGLDEIRGLRAPSYVAVLPIDGCSARGIAGLCTEAQFRAKLAD